MSREQQIIRALRQLGGTATVKQIADHTRLNVNGVMQFIASPFTTYLDGEGEDARYAYVEPPKLRLVKRHSG